MGRDTKQNLNFYCPATIPGKQYPNNMSPLVGLLTLMKPAQAVTERYINNLLRNGQNREFEIAMITRDYSMADGVVVGTYYTALVQRSNGEKMNSVGVTPSQAVRRSLIKHGVTFR